MPEDKTVTKRLSCCCPRIFAATQSTAFRVTESYADIQRCVFDICALYAAHGRQQYDDTNTSRRRRRRKDEHFGTFLKHHLGHFTSMLDLNTEGYFKNSTLVLVSVADLLFKTRLLPISAEQWFYIHHVDIREIQSSFMKTQGSEAKAKGSSRKSGECVH